MVTDSSFSSASSTGARVIVRAVLQFPVLPPVKVTSLWLPVVAPSVSTVTAPVSSLVTVTVTSSTGSAASFRV